MASPVRVATCVWEFARGFAAIELRARSCARPRESRVDSLEKLLGRRSLSQRQQQRFVELCTGALRFGIVLANGLDLVAEEVDSNGSVHFRRVHVEKCRREWSPGPCILDDIHTCVADGDQMLDEHFWDVLFTFAQAQCETGVVVARE